jgi:quinol monooxygenase YgiN
VPWFETAQNAPPRHEGSGFINTETLRHSPKHRGRSNWHDRSIADRHRLANTGADTMDNSANQNLVVTAFWQVNPGEEGAIAGLLKEFLPQAQQEPGVKEFQIHQNTAKPNEFFFYEVFAGEAAFAVHQQTRHFKDIIVGQAIPKLAKRERAQFRFI